MDVAFEQRNKSVVELLMKKAKSLENFPLDTYLTQTDNAGNMAMTSPLPDKQTQDVSSSPESRNFGFVTWFVKKYNNLLEKLGFETNHNLPTQAQTFPNQPPPHSSVTGNQTPSPQAPLTFQAPDIGASNTNQQSNDAQHHRPKR